jgi:hypothetical protein
MEPTVEPTDTREASLNSLRTTSQPTLPLPCHLGQEQDRDRPQARAVYAPGPAAVDNTGEAAPSAVIDLYLYRLVSSILCTCCSSNHQNLLLFGNKGVQTEELANRLGSDLAKLGVLSRGHVIVCNREDIVANSSEGTIEKATERANAAAGGILLLPDLPSMLKVRGGQRLYRWCCADVFTDA